MKLETVSSKMLKHQEILEVYSKQSDEPRVFAGVAKQKHGREREIEKTNKTGCCNTEEQADPLAPPAEDVAGLQAQLENCRTALRLQSARSRQLFAAYSTKLREKDAALRKCEREAETRLAAILRALVALEANLRREQRSIRAQLVEKDRVINEQCQIISRLLSQTKKPCSNSSSYNVSNSSNNSIVSSPQSTSINSSSNNSSPTTSEREIVTMKSTTTTTTTSLSVFENVVSIDEKENNKTASNIQKSHHQNIKEISSKVIQQEQQQHKQLQAVASTPLSSLLPCSGQQYNLKHTKEHKHYTGEKYFKSAKPPMPPKPNVHTPYRPILKFSVAQQHTVKKESSLNHSRSLPELSFAQQRSSTQRSTQEVCLLLAPTTRAAPTTHHMHPPPSSPPDSTGGSPPQINGGSNPQINGDSSPLLQSNNKSPHRVSRMVQRFERKDKAPRSLSCTALHSLRSPEGLQQKPPRGDLTLSPDDKNNNNNSGSEHQEECQDENVELYSLSSSENNFHPHLENNKAKAGDSPKYQSLDALRGNFEEFHLDSDNSEEEEEEEEEDILNRKEGDGAERNQKTVTSSIQRNGTSYEGFLEATGLSQKSILTPSRLSSATNSHRSVLKPRDVKFRSKANRCFNNGTVKYWAGPFL